MEEQEETTRPYDLFDEGTGGANSTLQILQPKFTSTDAIEIEAAQTDGDRFDRRNIGDPERA
jgi:hypothetical protein